MKKTYKRPYDIDLLRELYLTENMSAPQIAKKFDLPLFSVEHDLSRNGIHKPRELLLLSQGCKKWINEEDLREFYLVQNHSILDTAKHFNVHEKTIRRNLKAFGIKKPLESQRILRNQKMLEKYGTPEFQNSEHYRKDVVPKMMAKMKETNLRKYGVEHVSQLSEVKEATRRTFLKKYGCGNPNQSPEQRHKGFSKYYYKGLRFDSGWELALWIYAKDHNEDIEREPIRIEYESEGLTHYYFPDFRYKGELVEIKGDHLINENGVLIDRGTGASNANLKAKTDCMRKHGVRILRQKDVQFALDYVRVKYGSYYLRSFKRFKKDLEVKESEIK